MFKANYKSSIELKISTNWLLFLRWLWFLSPQKNVRKHFLSRKYPWGETSGELYIPGIYNLGNLALQKVDLKTGRIIKQRYKGTGQGHSVICSKNGRGWLIPENGFEIVEFDKSTLLETGRIVSEGNLFGGHGDISEDGQRIFYVDRGTDDKSIESDLVEYDIKQKKIINRYKQVGIYPHDVKLFAEGRFAIVASYGRVAEFVGVCNRLSYSDAIKEMRKPSFAVIDLKSGKIIAKHVFSETFTLAHCAIDSKNSLAFVQGTEYGLWSDLGIESVNSLIEERKIPLSLEEKYFKTVFLPAVQVKVNLKNFEVEENLRRDFYRAQSIDYAKNKGLVAETFAISNLVTLNRENQNKAQKKINTADLGVCNPRGLAFSDDGNMLFISGRQKNILCCNLGEENKTKYRIIRCNTCINSHISFLSN